VGHSLHFGVVLALYYKSSERSAKKDIMCVMQRAEYLEGKLLYLCLECLANFELASQLLERVQQRELEQRIDFADSKHSDLVSALMDIEADLNAWAESEGSNKAVRSGESITQFTLQGAIAEKPATLIPALLDIGESLQALLRTIANTAKG